MLNAIIRWSLRNRTLVLAVAAGLLVWGAYTAQHAAVDVLPRFAPPQVVVQTGAPGFPPRQVEQQITFPLESALLGLPGITDVRSSSITGLSTITGIFSGHSTLAVDRELVAQALAAAPPLPAAAGPPRLAPPTSAIGYIYEFGLTGAALASKAGAFRARGFAEWVVRPRLLSVPGVANVTVYGGRPRQYQLVVAPERLRQYHLTLAAVVAAAGQASAQGAGGFFQTPGQDLVIHAGGQVTSLAQLRDSVVAMRHGVPVTLGAIARIQYGAPPAIGGATVNGQPAVVMQVFEQPGASTVPTTRAVERALAGLAPHLPAGLSLRRDLFSQADFIHASVGDLRGAMWEGGILVVLILLLFLRSLRGAVISIIAIPLSLLIAILILTAAGATLNAMTLGGLVLALGEVVDDSIIDVENISRRLRASSASARAQAAEPTPERSAGRAPSRLALAAPPFAQAQAPPPAGLLALVYHASAEVRDSVVHATLSVALVFLPIFFLAGLDGRIFAPLGEAYILATLSSLLVALTLTPVLAYWLLARDGGGGGETAFAHWLKQGYSRLVRATLAHPRAIGAASLAGVIAAVITLPFMGGVFMPAFAQNNLIVHMASVPGTSLRVNLAAGAAFERAMLRQPGVVSVAQRDGRAELGEDTTPVNYTEFDVRFRGGHSMAAFQHEVQAVTARFPEFDWSMDDPTSERINEVLAGDTAPFAAKIFGPDESELQSLAARAQGLIAAVPGAADVRQSMQATARQVEIQFNRRPALSYGITSGAVTRAVRTALIGQTAGTIYRGRRRFPLVVKLPAQTHNSLAAIGSIPVRAPASAGGTSFVPLSSVAHIAIVPSLAIIHHENGQRVVTVLADVAGTRTVSAIRRRLAASLRLPPDYYLTLTGQFQGRAAAVRRLGGLGVVALAGIMFLLFYAFRAWRDAWLVLLNIPLAFIGGILAVGVSGTPVSIATLIGFIALFGIALRNGIMLVTHYRHLQREEGERFSPSLIVRGASERLVPILMTALAYGLALLPIVLAGGRAGATLVQPMAIVILGGLFTATILNLLVLPTLCLRYDRPYSPLATSVVRHTD